MFLPIPLHGEGIRRRAHRAAGGNHPGSGPVVRQPACRSRAWRAQSPPRIPYGGKGGAPRAGRTEFPPHIAGQAATIRAAALLTVSRPAGPAHGGRNRRRACHMAERGSVPRRQDGVPSAHRAAGGNHPGSGPVDRQPACRSLLAHGGRNRRRACHMAGRGSVPHRQDGVPSAHRGSGGNHPGSGPVVRQPACRSRAWRAQSPPRMPYGGKGERPAQAGRSSLRAIARRRKRAGGAQTPEIGACKSARRVVE